MGAPVVTNQGGQEFVFGDWVFDVDAALHIIRRNPRGSTFIDVDQFAESIGLNAPHTEYQTDDVYATREADISDPVLLVTLPSSGGGESHLMIDGYHRLRGAVIKGVREIPAYVLSAQETRSIQGRMYRR